MKTVNFSELNGENKLTAITQMVNIKTEKGWPNGATWNNEDELISDLEQDYNPNEHFSFYVNDFDEVETKIA